MAMSSGERARLRAKLLLERMKVYFRVCTSTVDWRIPGNDVSLNCLFQASYNAISGGPQRVKLVSAAPVDIEEMAKLL